MSVIIRLQNLPWSANAMDIRNFFSGLSIPEGGVHIVGGEQGDAFIAFSTDEDARQAMMNNGGKLKEVQIKLLLSSRSEMHKVIEAAHQSVSLIQIAAQPAITLQPPILPPSITGLFAQNLKIPTSLPQTYPMLQSDLITNTQSESINDLDKDGKRSRDAKSYERKSGRSRSKSRDRDSKGRGRDKKDKRDRSRSRDRSRDRRRRDRSRSRDRRDRKRDRKDRSRDRDRSKERTGDPRLQRKDDKKVDLTTDDNLNKVQQAYMGRNINQKFKEGLLGDFPPNPRMDNLNMPTPSMSQSGMPPFNNARINQGGWKPDISPNNLPNQPKLPMVNNSNNKVRTNVDGTTHVRQSRFTDNPNMEQIHRLQELDERRNPNAFQNTDVSPFNSRNVAQRPPFHNPNNVRMPTQNFNTQQNDPRNRFSPNTANLGLCVNVQNLLTSTGYGDIRRFFSGNFISNQGLKIINNDNGKRSGTAYVKFFKIEGKQNALAKNGQMLKGKPVYITHLDDEEFENAVDSYRPPRESDESADEGDSQKSLVIVENHDNDEHLDTFKVLLLEDLPAFAKEHDIMKMFSDYSLLSIIIVVTKDVRKQYVAYVQFVNADDAKAALNNKSKHLIGHKVIKVSPCSEASFEVAKNNQNNMSEIDELEIPNDMHEDFHHEAAPIITSRDPRQRRFDSRQDDMVGFTKQHKPFSAVPNPAMMNPRFHWRGNNPNSMNSGNHFNERDPSMIRRPIIQNDYNGPAYIDAKLDCTFLKGLPLRTTDRDILDFFSDVGVIPSKIHLMLTIHGQPSGDCFCEFIEPSEAVRAATKNRSTIGNNVITVELVTKQVVDDARGVSSEKNFSGRGGFRGSRGFPLRGGMRRMRGGPGPYNNGGRGGGRFMGPSDPMFSKTDNGGPEGFGVPGCVLSLENVPFRAGIDEILEFFSDYNLVQADVIRRFNENGNPTGDVRVCLRTPVEAQRALQQLNNRSIRDRKIIISMM